MSAETATDVKGTRKGKKKKKKGQSTDERETSPAAAGGESAEKVAVSGDDVSQPAPVTSASSKPGDEPGDNGEVKPGDDKPGAQMTGESEAASRLGAEVEKPGGSNQSSGERRPGGSEQRSGNAGNPGPSDRSGVGAGAGRGAAEAADVTGGQHEVGRFESWIRGLRLSRYG